MIFNINDESIYLGINQTNNFCCFGTSIGFYIYQINPFQKVISRRIDGGVSIVKMLSESNIILIVGKSNVGLYPNNKLVIWDDQKKDIIGEMSYNTQIINLEVTKKNIIVMTNTKILIYNFDDLILDKTFDNSQNNAIMAVGLNSLDYIIYPSNEIGSIHIKNISGDDEKCFKMHDHSITNLKISNDGKYLVTSSEKGTLIKILDIENLKIIKEVRRGCDPTKITDLQFSDNNNILLVSSVKGTIHLYNTNISDDTFSQKNRHINLDKIWGVSTIKKLVPNNVKPSYFSSEWSFSQIYIPNIVTYSTLNISRNKIYSFGNDGQFYEICFNDVKNPTVDKIIKYISDENDPFSERTSTIK